MKTRVYIDGFNLYYGISRFRHPRRANETRGVAKYRWLNVARMCELLLPNDEIVGYKYFTALVTATGADAAKPQRQRLFIRALETIPNLEVHYGHFITREKAMPLVRPSPSEATHAIVWKTEEKGSDVNLACHFLNDAFKDEYDTGVIVSNDSDLLAAVEIVRSQMNKTVGILNPHQRPSIRLIEQAHFVKHIRESVLRASLFPEVLQDRYGAFRKPEGW